MYEDLVWLQAVVPLNEECGLIEWIQNLNGLRQILHRIYRDTGIYMTGQELKQNMCKIDTPLATKRDIFKNKLVPRHPPVFGEWFLRNFPDPQVWWANYISVESCFFRIYEKIIHQNAVLSHDKGCSEES